MKKTLALLFISIFFSCTNEKINYKEFKDSQDYTIPLFNNTEKKTNQPYLFFLMQMMKLFVAEL